MLNGRRWRQWSVLNGRRWRQWSVLNGRRQWEAAQGEAAQGEAAATVVHEEAIAAVATEGNSAT